MVIPISMAVALKPIRKLFGLCFAHIELLLIGGLIVVAAFQYFARPQSQTYEQIIESGELRVLITDEPDSQYVFNRQHFGFEYALLETFARSLGAELKLEVVPYGQIFTLLDEGVADLAVGGILQSPFVERVSQPSVPWFKAQTTVVYKRGTQRPLSLEDLAAESVLTSARYFGIEQLNALNLQDDHRSEYQLLSAVDSGNERFVLSTNYRARNAKHYLPNLNRSFILPDKLDVVWTLPKRHDAHLLAVLNQFLETAVADGLPDKLADYYFSLPKRLSTYDALAIHRKIKNVLPEFEYAFRKAAYKGRIDWQLLAAMSYQESRWSNGARSPTGVRGIMQLTTNTANFLGVDDRMDMSQSIDASARYMLYLRSRLPKKITEPQRTWFAVGAYNMGLKHILAAYRKAREQGLERTQWNSVSQLLPTLYGKPFDKGVQAKHYVERVQIFTDILRFYDLHQRVDTQVVSAKQPENTEIGE
ncbi:MAG: membrane-bound lytic murein transglycosylase F [Cryomorphaceae bacterium]|jgi:membrane-bound lytic murein transglycosylase F